MPRLRSMERKRRAGLVEERDRVDRAIDRPHFTPDDTGNGLAFGGRRHRDVGWDAARSDRAA